MLKSQQHYDEWHPVAYYSKSMSDAERNYEIHDKKMLAIVQALQKWCAELEELQLQECFNIYTDHQSLEYFMTIKKLNACQAWWTEFLSQFYFLIQYHSGKQNTLADALSQSHQKSETYKQDYCLQILLKPDALDPQVKTDIPVDIQVLDSNIQIIDQVLQANHEFPSLKEQRVW